MYQITGCTGFFAFLKTSFLLERFHAYLINLNVFEWEKYLKL